VIPSLRFARGKYSGTAQYRLIKSGRELLVDIPLNQIVTDDGAIISSPEEIRYSQEKLLAGTNITNYRDIPPEALKHIIIELSIKRFVRHLETQTKDTSTLRKRIWFDAKELGLTQLVREYTSHPEVALDIKHVEHTKAPKSPFAYSPHTGAVLITPEVAGSVVLTGQPPTRRRKTDDAITGYLLKQGWQSP